MSTLTIQINMTVEKLFILTLLRSMFLFLRFDGKKFVIFEKFFSYNFINGENIIKVLSIKISYKSNKNCVHLL